MFEVLERLCAIVDELAEADPMRRVNGWLCALGSALAPRAMGLAVVCGHDC